MKQLFVFATDLEATAVDAIVDSRQTAVCGVGAVEAAVGMVDIIERYKPEVVILCGIAGAYDRSLKIGDVVCVTTEQTATLPSVYINKYSATLPLPLKGVVSNTVMAVGAEPAGAAVENMEGAAVFAVCRRYGIPCAEIRAISNYVDDAREQWDIPTALTALAKTIQTIF